MDPIDCIVVGAGVVGLAIARSVALRGLETIVVEAAEKPGTGISSRNSEVIHAGLHGAPGSLKARLCVEGRERLYRYCQEHAVPHRCCGKLVVATAADEVEQLHRLHKQGAEHGVVGLELMGPGAARRLEPELDCIAALHVPCSGIVDSHALMQALHADFEQAGGLLAVASTVLGARRAGGRWIVRSIDAAGQSVEVAARWLINSAGLGAQRLAHAVEAFPPARVPALRLAKGHYFSLCAAAPFSRLVYPVPVAGGLGIHCTIDLGGQAKFGPDVEWLAPSASPDEVDYSVDDTRLPAFEQAIRRYWPGIADGRLAPAYAGVRPKLNGPGEAAADFVIDGPREHGCDGLVQLFGIESPGLTASLAIAEYVTGRVMELSPLSTPSLVSGSTRL